MNKQIAVLLDTTKKLTTNKDSQKTELQKEHKNTQEKKKNKGKNR